MKQIISFFLLLIFISSCHKNPAKESSYMADDKVMAGEITPVTRQSSTSPTSPPNETTRKEKIKKKIIKDGRLGIQVIKIEKTKTLVDSLVRSNGGYYANESLNNTDRELSYNLRIRVPSLNFEMLITGIEAGEGTILYKEIDARDVTDQFIDLETRLKNKRNYLKRYNDLLKKAKSIKEILEIEEKIRGLEEEIESTMGRLKYLSNLVDYSTLELTLSKKKVFKYTPANRDSFFERLKQSLSGGWESFMDFLLFLIKIWPFCIIAALIFYFWKRHKAKRKKKS